METKTDNELIAEFYCSQLGLKGVGLKDNHYYFGTVPVTYAYKGDLKFHTSWDWLMPVVEKIKPINGGTSYINVFAALESVKIELVYKAVVQFIKWHNANGRQQKQSK